MTAQAQQAWANTHYHDRRYLLPLYVRRFEEMVTKPLLKILCDRIIMDINTKYWAEWSALMHAEPVGNP